MSKKTLAKTGKPYPHLKVKFQCRHVHTGGLMNFDDDFLADTGFSEYLLLPRAYLPQLKLATGLQGSSKQRKAVERGVTSLLFSGFEITEISGYKPSSPIRIVLDCCGTGMKLFGRKLLNRWIAEFDGPKRLLSLMT